MNQTEDSFLSFFIARLNQPGVIGIALTGSYARGENQLHSDMDVDILVDQLPRETYTLQYLDNRLISLKYLDIKKELQALIRPEKAIWAIPGLSLMEILLDPSGQLAALKASAQNFKWDDLQDAANEYAVEELMGCAEEVHKIVSGLEQENESKVLYAVWGLFAGLANAVAVQRGLMIVSENLYFDILQDSIGRDHAWTKAFRFAHGAEFDANLPAYQTRGSAALELYKQTAFLFKGIIGDKHREVIENTLQLIGQINR